ncbi:MAG: trypsin-like peptidase domain-containing protein [Lentisphaeria bacterium]|nr:trypsin-like peptidase domain-containing protein [Lentisphaeria bacterium]
MKIRFSTLVAMIFAALGIPGLFSAPEARLAPAVSAVRVSPTVKAVNSALPWVVNIGTQELTRVNDPFDLFFNQFFNPHYQRQKPVSKFFPLGSGVIVDPAGLILTNYHVVQRASSIEVRLLNGKSYPALMVGHDQPNDLCLLRLKGEFLGAEALTAASFANSDDLLLGETVISIGNPFGLEHSVSSGVLSAFNRSLSEGNISFADIIQTDAAINPGNSGGPLVNLDGDLIGINLAIRQDAQGIGFAIPLARIELFLSYWLRPVHFSNCYLGLQTDGMLSEGKNGGLCLPELLANSPMSKAGLQAGDEILLLDGSKVTRRLDFARKFWSIKANQVVEFGLAGGRLLKVQALPMPEDMLIRTRLGVSVQKLTPALRQAMGFTDDINGLAISELLQQERFSMQRNLWRDIIKRGDIILEFDGKQVPDTDSLASILEESYSGQTFRMIVISINHLRRTYQPLAVDVTLN